MLPPPGTGTFALQTTNAGLNLSGTVSGAAANLTTANSITQSGGIINAASADLEATNGDIGTSTTSIQTNATALTVNGSSGNTAGNAFINDTSNVTLATSQASTFQLNATGIALGLASTVSTDNATFTATGNAGISIGANSIIGLAGVNAVSVVLNSTGSGSI